MVLLYHCEDRSCSTTKLAIRWCIGKKKKELRGTHEAEAIRSQLHDIFKELGLPRRSSTRTTHASSPSRSFAFQVQRSSTETTPSSCPSPSSAFQARAFIFLLNSCSVLFFRNHLHFFKTFLSLFFRVCFELLTM